MHRAPGGLLRRDRGRPPLRLGLLALAALLVAVTASLASGQATPDPSLSPRLSAELTPSPSPSFSAELTPSPVPTPPPAPGHELFGFVPYWEIDAGIADHLAATPLSTLALFSVTTRRGGAINTGQPGYQQITSTLGRQLITQAQRRGARVELVYTSFGTARNRRLFERPALERKVVAALVQLAADLGVDGINVDVELLDPTLIPAYGEFVGELRTALRAGDSSAQVSVATTANETGAAMALAAVESGADRVFVMAYDYRTGSSSPGATSPVARRDGSQRDLPWSLDIYAALGVPVQRTILGLPLYGYAWPVAGPTLDAPATGRGVAWIPRRHLDLLTDPRAVPLHDQLEGVDVYLVGSDGSVGPPEPAPSESATPAPAGPVPDGIGLPPRWPTLASPAPSPTMAAGTGGSRRVRWQAIYVDSPATLGVKMQLALDRGLAGVGFWAIGYERGLPGYRRLMRDFAAGSPLP